MQLKKDDNVWDKILPVVFRDAKIYSPIDRIQYVTYWQDKSLSIENALKTLDPINATSIYQELKSYKEITQNIDEFLTVIKDKLNTSPDDLFNKFYSPLIEKIGVQPDFTKMAELIPISLISDPTLRLKTLTEYIEANKIENSYSYSMLASCHRDLGDIVSAVNLYKKSIEFDDFNYTAWNNLGQIYQLVYKNYSEAKKAYEKAIIAKPDFDIPRLNLGTLLSNHLGDIMGAKEQYEEILKFDENNPKAHNNLANIYRSKDLNDISNFEKHIIIAVNQNNLEATINYANYLKAVKGNLELGNKYYQKAKELDTDNLYTEMIDLLIKSTKG
jgi:tetratricopeptide (TPR) repeat protein